MADVRYRTQDREDPAAEGLLIRLQPALCPTEDQFYEFCRINADLRIERNADGGVAVMEPAGWETADQNAEVTCQLKGWATANGKGRAVDSSESLVRHGQCRCSWPVNVLSRSKSLSAARTRAP